MNRYAIIPSNGRDCLWQSLDAVEPQVDRVFIIDTGKVMNNVPVTRNLSKVTILAYLNPGPLNISRWWNLGLDEIDRRHRGLNHEPYNVAIINDDAIVPLGWFDAVTAWMTETGSVAGCSGTEQVVHREPVAVPLHTRMCGYAFVLAAAGIRADVQFEWWAGDDDIDWTARTMGGMAMVRGFQVQHLHPNGQMTPQMHVQAAGDMQRFVDKWGRRPW